MRTKIEVRERKTDVGTRRRHARSRGLLDATAWLVALSIAQTLAGCSSPSNGGSVSAVDSGAANVDAGSPADSGSEADSGALPESGAAGDAGSNADSGSSRPDSGSQPDTGPLSNCGTGTFVCGAGTITGGGTNCQIGTEYCDGASRGCISADGGDPLAACQATCPTKRCLGDCTFGVACDD